MTYLRSHIGTLGSSRPFLCMFYHLHLRIRVGTNCTREYSTSSPDVSQHGTSYCSAFVLVYGR